MKAAGSYSERARAEERSGERRKDKESERGCQKVRLSDEQFGARKEGTVISQLRHFG